jgi:glycosidase
MLARASTRRLLLALSVATATAAALIAPAAMPASAEHTPLPSRVTLMGSLMSELGCTDGPDVDGSADWDPDCTATDMTRVGDTTAFQLTGTLPAGDYEFKVRLNGSWDENYGVNGAPNGNNYPLHLAVSTPLVFSYDHATHETTVLPQGWAPATVPTSEDTSLARDSLRAPLTRERFYFVMADRFANADPTNDRGGLTGGRDVTGYDPSGKGWYHGGDIAGLTERINYIKNLGTTAIWLTPSFKNKPVQGTGSQQSAGYHGYWVTDFTQVDPHFGTNAELADFIAKAHAKGMKVFFDIITNHTADVLGYPDSAYVDNAGIRSVPYVSKATEPYRDVNGTEFDDADYASGGNGFPDVDTTSFPYTPTFLTPADETAKTPAWLNDPTMYHNRGTSTFSGENSLYGDFPSGDKSALDDLWTERPDVVEGMEDIYKTWIDFGIDGFRIDTVKHVNMEFWQQFAPAIQQHAKHIGNGDFFSFGEVYDASAEFMSQYTTTGRLQATLDFGFQDRSRGFDKGKRTSDLAAFFANDDYFTDTDSNAYQLPTFLGNHDMGRVGYFIKADHADAGAAELLQRDKMLHSLMYLTRGQPVVYYGDEQGFVGDGGDQDARQDMFASQVASYNDDPMIGSGSLGSRDRYNQGSAMYRFIDELADLVTEHPALRDGAQIPRFAESQAGVFAVSRIDRTEKVEYLVALNNSATSRTVSLPTYSAGMRFQRLWPVSDAGTVSDSSGAVTVTVPALSAQVWRATAPLAVRDSAPAITFSSLRAGSNIGKRAEIGVAPDTDAFSQVSFAYRPYGSGGGWTYLGTDDNAPYRVFHDVSGVQRGTMLEYRAVLKDSSGNLSVTSTIGVVGDPKPVKEPPVTSVTVAGDFNSEMGCSSDWAPDCAKAHLTLGDDGLWTGSFPLPAGAWQYKIAINDAWDVNYGAGGVRNGGNISLNLAAGTTVSFSYDPVSHVVTTVPPSG